MQRALGDFFLVLGRTFSALEDEMSQFLDFAFRQQFRLPMRFFSEVVQGRRFVGKRIVGH